MEVKEQNQKRGDERRIEAPAPDAGAARTCEMVVGNPGHDPEARKELHNLAICDKFFPPGTLPYRAQEVVEIHYNMHRRVYDKNPGKKRLRGVERYVAHDHNGCMVIHVEKSQPSDGVAQDDQESVHELENLREIENMRPEEERPFRRGVHGVANDVVHVGCVVNDGEGAAGGHGEGESEEEDVMHGCEKPEGARPD
ncbi:hypothetical protein OIU77_027928 [Salix suchowensis]|uniref:Uncharacterized protein n=1 Tax=Salix suchowensis TaxID=1278906 RepID=A0ABQ9BTU2_9ROSI|nr:hypothetical protein OIU77_027928 [Salix suchowensis]